MEPDVADIRLALIRQWELVADAVDGIDLSTDSRCSGWTNREVLAHLYVQPYLVARFLLTAGTYKALLGAADNLAGTSTQRQLIDVSARDGAALNKVRLRGPLEEVRPLVLSAQLEATITTLQGPISVSDYLVTRCVEAVVHGGDLEPPVTPDAEAQGIAAKALIETLAVSAPELVEDAEMLPLEEWINLATGRTKTIGPLAAVLPVMA